MEFSNQDRIIEKESDFETSDSLRSDALMVAQSTKSKSALPPVKETLLQGKQNELGTLPEIQIRVPSYSKEVHTNGSITLRDAVGLRIEISADVDEKTKNAVEFYAANLPQNLRERLAAANVPIYVVNKMSDLNPAMKDLPLPVQDPRKSWDEVGAAYFDNKEWNMLGKKGVVITPRFSNSLWCMKAHTPSMISRVVPLTQLNSKRYGMQIYKMPRITSSA